MARRLAPCVLAACALLGLALAPVLALSSAGGPVDFARDVRPILSENCFACHGFDPQTRQAGLRLDERDGALRPGRSGKPAVKPGRPQESELLRRVSAHDALRMPPAATGKSLTRAQVEVLKRWIEQGAPYGQHWAFVAPVRPRLPAVKRAGWARNPIDRFILARLEREGLQPSPEADRRTLIRRLSLDLTGLPPTIAEVEAFLGDLAPGAYERLVDRLLASPHHGERMALKWLDLARYADTHGYHIDSHRDMWRWRDWVIDAYNRNLPYDRFLTEQLAGDLLPGATRDQIVATGFNRNHPINYEGGAIPEEYQTAYVLDRVDTTATVFMGLTMRCGQCHDHKYDPITMRDFYRFYAYFNNVSEEGLDGQRGNAKPFIKAPTPEQESRLAAYDARIAALKAAMEQRGAAAASALEAWERGARADPAGPELAQGLWTHLTFEADERGSPGGRSGQGLALSGQGAAYPGPAPDFDRTDAFSYGAWARPDGAGAMAVLSRMDDSQAFRGWDLYLSGGRAYAHLVHQWEGNAIRVNTKEVVAPAGQWRHLFVTYDGSGKAGGVQIYVDGRPASLELTHDTLTGTIRSSAPVSVGSRSPGAPFTGAIDEVRIYSRRLSAAEVAQIASLEELKEILAAPAAGRTAAQREKLRRHFLEAVDGDYRRLAADRAGEEQRRAELDAAIPTTMVMEERAQARPTFMLIRGQYDRHGAVVTAGTPEFLPQNTAEAGGRLALAKWLAAKEHPLTARVAVNRAWQMLFGAGLVRSSENFGLQGDPPSHPELLDWLSVAFADGSLEGKAGTPWDQKALLRAIVTSTTYRQSSRATPRQLAADPENRLLGRAPRLRLTAEAIRDQALATSGLLSRRIGGPSVKPYQPPGLWEEIAFGGGFTAQTYQQDHGEALYRRSMYTFWKRTSPPPSLQTFDAPEREFCVVRRSTSNTPLQALVLMNDPTYVEAARKLAERIRTDVAASPRDRVVYAYRLVLARPPSGAETRELTDLYDEALQRFRKEPEAAAKLLKVGESPVKPGLDAAELAAWTTVASVLLNLDETISRG